MEWTINISLFLGALVMSFYLATTAIFAVTDNPPDWVPLEIRLEVDAPPDTDVLSKDGTAIKIEHKQTMALMHLPASFTSLHLTRLFFKMLLLGLGLFMAWQMRAIVRSLRGTTPFVADNALRLRRIAGLTLITYVIHAVYWLVLPMSVANYVPDLDQNLTLAIDLSPVFYALGIYIIAEIFGIGVKMKEEADLTV